MKIALLILSLLATVALGAPNSYPVPGGTAYLSDQGKVAVDPGTGLQTFQFPAMGMYGTKWIPIAVDASGIVQVSGGGGGGSNVNIHDSAGNMLTSTAGALDVSIASFPASVSVTQGTSPWVVSGSVSVSNFPVTQDVNVTNPSIAVTQSGTWSTGRTWTLSSGSDSVSAVVSNFPALQAVDLEQLVGSAPSVTNSLPVRISNGTSFVDPTQIRALTTSDQITAFQGGSWTVSSTQGTSPWVVSGTVAATQSGAWTTGRTWSLSSGTDSVTATISGTVPISGTVTANQGTSPWIVRQSDGTNSLTTLFDLDTSGITHQWNLGTSIRLPASGGSVAGGTASNPLRIDPTGTTTQPVSGTVTANQGGAWTVAATQSGAWSVSVSNFPATQAVTQSTSPWVVSGTVTANIGTTGGLALDSSVNGLLLTQGSTTSGEKGPLIQGAVTTAAPTYTTAQTNPLSLTTSGLLRVDASGTTIPISGTITANQGTSPWVVSGTVAVSSVSGTVAVTQSTSPWVVSGTVTSNQGTSPWVTNVSQFGGSNVATGTGASGSGIPRVTVSNDSNILATQSGTWTVQQGTPPWSVSQSGTWNINNISGTISLPTGAATEATLAKLPLAQASTTSGQSGPLVQGAVTTSAPTYTTGQTDPLSLTTGGLLRVDASGTTVPVSGTVTANQGGAPWSFNQTQVNGVAVSTGNGVAGTGVQRVTIASDNTAFSVNQGTSPWVDNVSQWGGSATSLGQKVSASSVPVVLASDQSAVTITTIPGNPNVATYAAVANFTTAALLTTDVFTILGSGTKTIQVRKITVAGTNSGNTNGRLDIIKRSTADSGGTSTTATLVPNDSNNAAATTVVRSYTVNPTLGTAVGAIDSTYCFFPTLASTNVDHSCEFTYGVLRDQAIYLRGTSEQLAVNLAGVTLGGVTVLSIKVEWTEE